MEYYIHSMSLTMIDMSSGSGAAQASVWEQLIGLRLVGDQTPGGENCI